MYITADAESEYETVLAIDMKNAKGVYGLGGPASVSEADVMKAEIIYTNTPDGRMLLEDYLKNIEKEIAAEEAAKNRDVAAVRAQMARNFAFNQAARAKLKKRLLHKMAVNAKKAQDDLHRSMRYVQHRFAKAAALANKRNRANIRRSAAIRARVAKDKAHAAHALRTAVLAQQRARAAVAAGINARISQTNKHVAANAAQIKENAKAASAALAGAMHKFDQKLANAAAEARKGRSKLAAQLAAQGKATRAWACNKLKVVAASTAAQFRKVRAEMARDRHHVDMAVKGATSRMSASLNAFQALNSKRFAKTVANINAARHEAAAMIAKAQTGFKTSILSLRATVKQQVAKTNARVTQLSGVVQKNKLEQARVNNNVNAEMKRMVKLGNKRYKEHLKKDKELKSLIQKNKAATDARMNAMAAHYTTELDKVRSTMRKNRAHATRELASHSAKLYAAIAKQQKSQMKINGKLAAQTRRARLAIADELRSAKRDFSKRLAKLHATIVHNDKKFDGKIKKLTGVVNRNAVKSKQGRATLAAIMKANKASLLGAVSHAVHLGEKRMMKAEAHVKDMNQKTKSSLNMRITSEISKLASHIGSSIEGLRLNSKSARAEMRKEMLYAVRSAAAEAKKNLSLAVTVAKAVFANVAKKEHAEAKRSAAARRSISRKLRASTSMAKRSIADAVAGMNRSMLALKSETEKKIKKTNRGVDVYAKQMANNAAAVAAAMKANVAALTSKIDAARRATKEGVTRANAKSSARQATVLLTLKRSLAKARKRADAKFGKAYRKLAANRAHADKTLASAVNNMNDKLAQQAALADSRFSKTVKNIGKARKDARAQIAYARKAISTAVYAVTSQVKDQETRLSGEIAVVSGEVVSNRAAQMRVNRRTQAELKRITNLANQRHSASKRARGKLRRILDENKRAASEQVVALASKFTRETRAVRSQAARNAQDAAKDLTKATSRLYAKLAVIQLKNSMSNKRLGAKIKAYSAGQARALASVKKSFGARLSTLTNTITANQKKTEEYLEGITGVIRNAKNAGKKDRLLLKAQTRAIHADMNKKLVRAIQIGEARAKKIAEGAREHLAAGKKAILIEISERVEAGADKLFKTIQGNHKKIADNYLSLKAYAAAAAKPLKNYVAKGKGRNLSSLGDLLSSVALLAPIKPGKREGVAAGARSLPPIFGGKRVKAAGTVTKINGLVDEYIGVITAVRRRWPMGIGKYLLMKTEAAMQGKGVLQVDKVEDKAGNFVYLNAHSVGLSNKVNDFESLGVRLHHYEASLAKLTAKVATKKKKHIKKRPSYFKPPEWKGD
jgi:hypothetical protein